MGSIYVFWGKARPRADDPGQAVFLPLVDHCLDVALVFRQLAALPTIRARLDAAAGTSLSEPHCDRLAVLALLHDAGKANLGFQDKLRPGAPNAGHIRELAPLFDDEELNSAFAAALDAEFLLTWFAWPEALEQFLIAAWSHHGRPVRFPEGDRSGNYHLAKTRWWRPNEGRDPMATMADLLAAARKAFPDAFAPGGPPIPDRPALQHRFAGLVMLADWLGSHEGFFPLKRLPESPPDPARALAAVGLDVRTGQRDLKRWPARFGERFGFEAPHPLQAAISGLLADAPDSQLLIAEAETGSGKTEAALARFFTLFAAGEVDALYFALPTRVAARELYRRVLKYVGRAFPDPAIRPPVVLAVPGYARVDGETVSHVLPGDDTRWQDDAAQARKERLWAAEHPKRFLAAPVAVGTIDQALLSAVQAPHAHLRSVCLDRSLLVVDEVHASDPYMRRLLAGLLAHHVGLGGHAVLLSATLGSGAREEFLAAAGVGTSAPNLKDACHTPYPAVTDLSGVPRGVGGGTTTRSKPVRFSVEPHMNRPETLLPAISDALAAGARVLVVMNTVDRALAMQRAAEVHPDGPDTALFRCEGVVCPHHGRFAPTDRELLDAAVTACWGKESPTGAALLIGTQTLEQSLDIDADLLVTDLCPADVLLQRVGRLHRHTRPRPPGFETAHCIVLAPDVPELEVLLDGKGRAIGQAKKAGLGSVYEDLRTLELTRRMLLETADVVLPADNRRLVEGATHPERLASLQGDPWQRHGQEVDGNRLAQEVTAHFASATFDKPFGTFTFQELGERARTRLGLDTLRVPLGQVVESPFGVPLTEVTVPGHLVPGQSEDETAVVVRHTSEEVILSYGDRCYRYSRFGLEAADEPAD